MNAGPFSRPRQAKNMLLYPPYAGLELALHTHQAALGRAFAPRSLFFHRTQSGLAMKMEE